ncbi:MAG: TetR family transcriptional regulator [Aequorivita sp.]|nr:TetR family transcriptional regulator [Aequorivita sp.]|tara:strand:+ start:117636 stop:118247 length:612 start_codon:yes stop_codon:yes gene_type:complete
MKDKIVQKASNLFLKLGFKSVTMDDIAAALAISKKTIYIHFKNKTSLVEECAFSVFRKITTRIEEIRAESPNPIEELFEIKKYVMDKIEGEQTSSQYQLQKYYPEISKNIKAYQFDKFLNYTIDNLHRGIKHGYYRENLNTELIARLYFLGIHGIKDQSLFPKEKFSPTLLNQEYLIYHLRSIVTSKGLSTLNKLLNANTHDE